MQSSMLDCNRRTPEEVKQMAGTVRPPNTAFPRERAKCFRFGVEFKQILVYACATIETSLSFDLLKFGLMDGSRPSTIA